MIVSLKKLQSTKRSLSRKHYPPDDMQRSRRSCRSTRVRRNRTKTIGLSSAAVSALISPASRNRRPPSADFSLGEREKNHEGVGADQENREGAVPQVFFLSARNYRVEETHDFHFAVFRRTNTS